MATTVSHHTIFYSHEQVKLNNENETIQQ